MKHIRQRQLELVKKIARWIDRTNKSEKELSEKEFNQFLFLCEQLDKLRAK